MAPVVAAAPAVAAAAPQVLAFLGTLAGAGASMAAASKTPHMQIPGQDLLSLIRQFQTQGTPPQVQLRPQQSPQLSVLDMLKGVR